MERGSLRAELVAHAATGMFEHMSHPAHLDCNVADAMAEAMVAKLEAAAFRRGMQRAAEIADGHAADYVNEVATQAARIAASDIAAAIRAEAATASPRTSQEPAGESPTTEPGAERFSEPR
jgi:hypothetical protein